MALIKARNFTPKLRWQKTVKLQVYTRPYFYFCKKNKTNHRLTLTGCKNLYGLRRHKPTILYFFFIKRLTISPHIVTGFNFQKKPLKEFVYTKNFFNQIHVMLYTNSVFPGFVFYPVNLVENNTKLVNQLTPLMLIPINYTISFIFNNLNNYAAYSKSSGCSAVRRKILKKLKLIYVELPSKSLKLFGINTYAVTAPVDDININCVIEGGWGFFKTNKKVINVRGVAKNPVDHPNGGRTKAKQPEYSPWGWIDKLTK